MATSSWLKKVSPLQPDPHSEPPQTTHQPALNIPAIIVVFVALLVAIHLLRLWEAGARIDHQILLFFSFIPGRYYDVGLEQLAPMALYWTPITYSLLHADWLHLLMNIFWMIAFGSPVAKRLGTANMLLFFAMTAIGGAFIHWVVHMRELVPMIGASAIVSGMMGAASRFAFGRHLPLPFVHNLPSLTLSQTFANKQSLTFLLVWFGLNFLFGSGIVPIFGEAGAIAWEAHVGGFLVGLLGFDYFDRKFISEDNTRHF